MLVKVDKLSTTFEFKWYLESLWDWERYYLLSIEIISQVVITSLVAYYVINGHSKESRKERGSIQLLTHKVTVLGYNVNNTKGESLYSSPQLSLPTLPLPYRVWLLHTPRKPVKQDIRIWIEYPLDKINLGHSFSSFYWVKRRCETSLLSAQKPFNPNLNLGLYLRSMNGGQRSGWRNLVERTLRPTRSCPVDKTMWNNLEQMKPKPIE